MTTSSMMFDARARRAIAPSLLATCLLVSPSLTRGAHAEPAIPSAPSTPTTASAASDQDAAEAAGTAGTAAAEEPATEQARQQVRAHHRRGLALFDEGDYRLALVEFERAHSISNNYKILFNIGQVYFQLGKYAKARKAFERYLESGKAAISEARRAAVESDLATLRARTATLTIRANAPDAEILVNGESIGKAPLDAALVDAGILRVEASSPGFLPKAREVTLVGGDEREVSFELTKLAADAQPAEPKSSISGAAIAGWIVTGALAVGAIGTGVAASVAASDYDDKRERPISGSPAEARSDLTRQRDLVNGLAITTDVLAASALVVGGVSLYLTLGAKPSASRASTSVPSASRVTAPRLGMGAGGIHLMVGF